MIDDGELDWKVIAIKFDDPLAKDLNDIGDVETKLPGTVSGKLYRFPCMVSLVLFQSLLICY